MGVRFELSAGVSSAIALGHCERRVKLSGSWEIILLLVCLVLTPRIMAQGGARVHLPPTRPTTAVTPFKSIRLGGSDYLRAVEVADYLGLKHAWLEPTRRLSFYDHKDPAQRVELSADNREIAVGGLRVFLGEPVRLSEGEFYLSRIDVERCLLPKLRPSLAGKPPRTPRVIVLDPGHGGSDFGMQNKDLDLKEKALTLDVALRVKKLLEAQDWRVVLTRVDDKRLAPARADDLKLRALAANRAGADLFVSIHFNSLYPDTKTSGTEIYTFTPARQRSARAWGRDEEDDTETESSPVNRYDAWSALLAQSLQRAVIDHLKSDDRGHKTMHSAVMRGLHCPGVLVESVFLSNDREARLAATPAYRQEIATAIAQGISAYVAEITTLQKPDK
ncbi:MAG: N-acetylmuramoyl-L-alanine amidase [Opitutaceae bacterium]|nr:N-acetylmuramoyl-L-alanine amidase [Opitutaceae bacterium]